MIKKGNKLWINQETYQIFKFLSVDLNNEGININNISELIRHFRSEEPFKLWVIETLRREANSMYKDMKNQLLDEINEGEIFIDWFDLRITFNGYVFMTAYYSHEELEEMYHV